MSRKKIARLLAEEMAYLRKHYGVRRIGMFGSQAKGTARNGSDVDLLVEFDRPIGFKFMDLGDRLEKRLGVRVDLLTPEGLRDIRVRKVAQNIRETVQYV